MWGSEFTTKAALPRGFQQISLLGQNEICAICVPANPPLWNSCAYQEHLSARFELSYSRQKTRQKQETTKKMLLRRRGVYGRRWRCGCYGDAVAPVGAPSVYCCGGERNVYRYGGAEESKGGGGEEEKDGDAAAALPRAVAPVEAPSVYSCGGAEEGKGVRRRRGCYVCARGGALWSAKRGGGGALRRVAR